MSRCALGRARKSGKSCFTLPELECMISAWNALATNDAIVIDKTNVINADELWIALIAKLKDQDERNWIENTIFMNKVADICPELAKTIKYLAFRPLFVGTLDEDLWLSQKDINHCLIQLLHSFRHTVANDLVFLGAHPVDHFLNCPADAKIPYGQDWGLVLNTASLSEGGEHWVALFHQKKTLHLEYFDSNGDPPPPRLNEMLTMLKQRNRYLKTTLRSKRKHQEDEYNCGVYSVLFLFLRFLNVALEKIEAEKMGYKHIHQFRALLFDTLPNV